MKVGGGAVGVLAYIGGLIPAKSDDHISLFKSVLIRHLNMRRDLCIVYLSHLWSS